MNMESPITRDPSEIAPETSAEAPGAYQFVLTNPTGIEAEAIRSLRTRTMAQHVREGRRALTLCTPTTGSGCTFVATNLAIALAQIGVKVALIDANLRRPMVGEAFGLRADAPGLADYLSDPAVSDDAILRETHVAGLSIIPAGKRVANPQELLSSERFRDLAGRMLREFDLTIFDTPPTNSCTDAQRISTITGYSLIVARKNASYVDDIATLSKLLRADRSTIVGCVLNDF
ncbi:MAG: CpsD/CapB family tyrosine-protein kinase [Sphingomonadaceae bacterium]|nr:CpsD/CapB family tyrosine-protein kinase [Sphingomonadaceae bacterium]